MDKQTRSFPLLKKYAAWIVPHNGHANSIGWAVCGISRTGLLAAFILLSSLHRPPLNAAIPGAWLASPTQVNYSFNFNHLTQGLVRG